MMLLKCCTQYVNKFRKLSSGHGIRKGQLSFQSQTRAMLKKCSNYHIIVLISDASKVMLKILQARHQPYRNQELPGIKPGFRKGRETKDKIANICWIWLVYVEVWQKTTKFCKAIILQLKNNFRKRSNKYISLMEIWHNFIRSL